MNINITKQQWTIIGVVVAIIAVWYFFLRKKKTESSFYGCKSDEYICGVTGSGNSAQTKCCPLGRRRVTAESGYIGTPPFRKRLDFMPIPTASAQPRYHCDWTDPRTGQVTTYEGPCNKAKANMGWVTIFS